MTNGFISNGRISVSGLLNIALLVGAIGSMVFLLETRYAKAAEVENILEAVEGVHCEMVKGRINDLRTELIYGDANDRQKREWAELQDKKIKLCSDKTRERVPV